MKLVDVIKKMPGKKGKIRRNGRVQPNERVDTQMQKQIRLAEIIDQAIFKKTGKTSATRYQVSDLRWFLEHQTAEFSNSRRYDYFLVIKRASIHLKKWQNWENHLQGSWTNREGEKRKPGIGGRKMITA